MCYSHLQIGAIKKDDEILDFSSMKGIFEKYSYTSFISNNKYKNKTSNYDPCNRYRFSVVNFIRIRYVPYNSGRSGGGGGERGGEGKEERRRHNLEVPALPEDNEDQEEWYSDEQKYTDESDEERRGGRRRGGRGRGRGGERRKGDRET